MLVSIAVENWRCFRDRQELSMETVGQVADEFAFDTGTKQYPRLNRVSALYGPNGSGKTYFVHALAFLKAVLTEVEIGRGVTETVPFLFDVNTPREPTTFEIVFIEDEVVYEYGFSVDSQRVYEEWLSVCPPNGRAQRWLYRKFDSSANDYEWKFSRLFRGDRKTWSNATRPDALFVPTAVRLNSESLQPISKWFNRLLLISDLGIPLDLATSILDRMELADDLISFLNNAGITVESIVQRERPMPIYLAQLLSLGTNGKNTLSDNDIVEISMPFFGHRITGSDHLAYIDISQESKGTRQMYSLALSWLLGLNDNLVMVVDELDRSLHPHLVQFLFKYINRTGRDGKQRTQLLATVHDATLLLDVLDRNQVWLTQKMKDQSAKITPLSDYKPRKNESLMRGYLAGRYNGIPNALEPETLD